jgi:hypothetical protein
MGRGPQVKEGDGRSTLSLVPAERTSRGGAESGGGSGAASSAFSAREASRFAPALRRVSETLALPEPVRTGVLLEMAGDLEAVYAHHRAAGLSEVEAARLAEERVLATERTAARLREVHAQGGERWLYAFSGRLRNDLEPYLFAIAVLPMAVLAVAVQVPQFGAMGGNPWLWAILGCLVWLSATAVGKARQLFGRRSVERAEMRAGLSQILFLGAIAPAIGAVGALIHLHRLLIALSQEAGPEEALLAMVEFGHHAALLGSSLILALIAGTIWLFLGGRVADLERAERILLLGE